MRQLSRHRAAIGSALVSALLAGLLLTAAVLPVLAKEGLLATFDAPIAMGTPGGTEILVGMMVTVPDGDVTHPVEGSPIYLKLTGRDGSSTEASGRVDDTPGHYTMRIAIPAGGARRVEVVIRGTTDLPIMLATDPLTFGGITARTAQLAPALPSAIAPRPRAETGAVVPAANPATVAGVEPSATFPLPLVLVVAAILVLASGLLVTLRRRTRAATRPIPSR